MRTQLAISGILGSDSAEREIRLGRHVAYGEIAVDGRTYNIIHAPTQADFDAIAAAMDAATPTEIREAIAGPSFVDATGRIITAEEI